MTNPNIPSLIEENEKLLDKIFPMDIQVNILDGDSRHLRQRASELFRNALETIDREARAAERESIILNELHQSGVNFPLKGLGLEKNAEIMERIARTLTNNE